MINTPACYDEKTEILTKNGWMSIKDVGIDLYVLTLLADGSFQFCIPQSKIEYFYTGKMDHYKNTKVDLLVTENHEMVIKNTNDKSCYMKLITSKEITKNCFFIKGLKPNLAYLIRIPYDIRIRPYAVKYLAEYILPLEENILPTENEWEDELNPEKYKLFQTGKDKYPVDRSRGVLFNRERFFKLYSFFFLFGNASYDDSSENIEEHFKIKINCNEFSEEYIEHIKNLLTLENISFYIENNRLVISHYTLCNFLYFSIKVKFFDFDILRTINQNYAKIIIDEIKKIELAYKRTNNKEQLRRLHSGINTETSISNTNGNKKLLDQFELIRLMSTNESTEIPINIESDKTTYDVELKTVYCLTVKNNTLLTRRNGKVAWCGNCKVKEGDV